MKKLIQYAFLISGIILFASCKQKDEKKTGTITGKLSSAKNMVVYLARFDEKGEYILDSALTDAEGNFKMENKATENDFYVFRTDPTNLIFLFLNGKENVDITGNAKDLENTYVVNGSEDSELIKEIKKQDKLLSDSLNSIYNVIRDKTPDKKDSVGAVLQKYFAVEMGVFAKNFISKHPKSLVSLSTTRYLDQQKDIDVFENLLSSLSHEYPNNKYVKDFEGMVVNLRKLPVGSVAPEITLNTPDGKQVSLSSLKGKIVLVDFWASWCGPCRKENPHIVEMYRKFKSKDFEILGVSLDDNVDAWKEAIRRDHLTWLQGSDLKKWDSQVARAYQVDAIPYSIIVDKSGKIIAKGLTGVELEQKLIEIL